ncbi:hypothetical protein BC941DRAFT_446285 [Chlamydoabsidia padenii]|nr:hypothetical protein BC941DRAFT_446285 [Chlamydoabsidia padenii]
MSALVFLSGNKKFDQFIPTYTTNINSSPPRRKRKRKQSNNHGNTVYSPQYHHHELPPSPTSTSSTSSLSSLSSATNTKKPHRRKSQCTMDNDEIGLETLEDEFDYTQDTLATLNVMFGSLRQAYETCEPQLTPHPTRLDAMEKELLSAYDDLELQVIHLDRHIKKLESSWRDWKSTNHHQPPL